MTVIITIIEQQVDVPYDNATGFRSDDTSYYVSTEKNEEVPYLKSEVEFNVIP